MRDSPNSNQQGHVTALDNHVSAFNDNERALANVEHLMDYPTTAPTSPYTYLETLRRDYHNGILDAIPYMQDLQDYTEDCLNEHRNGKRTSRQKSATTTTLRTPSATTLAGHDHGMLLMDLWMAYPVPSSSHAPWVLD